MVGTNPRYVVRPGFQLFERCVVDTRTDRVVWGPARDIRKAERVAAKLNGRPSADFSRTQIDDARQLILTRYGEMVQAARQSFYVSTAAAIRAAAGELVAEGQLTSSLAEVAVSEAIAFAAHGRRFGAFRGYGVGARVSGLPKDASDAPAATGDEPTAQ